MALLSSRAAEVGARTDGHVVVHAGPVLVPAGSSAAGSSEHWPDVAGPVVELVVQVDRGVDQGQLAERLPPFSASSSDAKTLGESNRGQQNQSTVPSVVTSAAVCRSPIRP